MRPEDIIEAWLHALKRRHANEWTPADAARELISALERENLYIKEPHDDWDNDDDYE